MELDELKTYLQQKFECNKELKNTDFQSLLQKKAASVIDKLRRSLQFEMLSGIVFGLMLVYAVFILESKSLQIFCALFAIFSVLFALGLLLLSNKIKQLSQSVLPIKNNLQSIYNIINGYVQFCFKLTMGLIPACLILAFCLGYWEGRTQQSNTSFHLSFIQNKTVIIALLMAWIILYAIGVYYFTRWYLNKLYKKYLEELKALINELNE